MELRATIAAISNFNNILTTGKFPRKENLHSNCLVKLKESVKLTQKIISLATTWEEASLTYDKAFLYGVQA